MLKRKKITVVYIIGAGRSGTTILSTLLGATTESFSVADLMQIYAYIESDKVSGDGFRISESPFWGKVINECSFLNEAQIGKRIQRNSRLESHGAIVKNILHAQRRSDVEEYLGELQKLYETISEYSGANVIIDSSKYPNRGLLLKRLSGNLEIKYIYNIRDVRGVVNSFSKTVQTPKTPFSAILYYNAINLMTEVVYRFLPSSDRMKVRYEDVISANPSTLERLSEFVGLPRSDLDQIVNYGQAVEVGPVIEGNRMVKDKKIRFEPDTEWVSSLPRLKQIIYFLLAFPVMLINRYTL